MILETLVLSKAQLKELTTSTPIRVSIFRCFEIAPISLVLCVLLGVGREILMETNELVFKLSLRFDICRMTSEEMRVP